MIKKLLLLVVTTMIALGSFILPASGLAAWFGDQRWSNIWVSWADVGGQWNEGFIWFVESAVNWILWLLALITIIILIWGWFQMITAAWDDGKYKKWFTIVKQAVIWLILIWASALIVNLVFSFMTTNTTQWGTAMIEAISTLV